MIFILVSLEFYLTRIESSRLKVIVNNERILRYRTGFIPRKFIVKISIVFI